MPQVSSFNGIDTYIYYGEQERPHFHARCQGREAQVDIGTAAIARGGLDASGTSLVVEWARLRQAELLSAWRQAAANERPSRIRPL